MRREGELRAQRDEAESRNTELRKKIEQLERGLGVAQGQLQVEEGCAAVMSTLGDHAAMQLAEAAQELAQAAAEAEEEVVVAVEALERSRAAIPQDSAAAEVEQRTVDLVEAAQELAQAAAEAEEEVGLVVQALKCSTVPESEASAGTGLRGQLAEEADAGLRGQLAEDHWKFSSLKLGAVEPSSWEGWKLEHDRWKEYVVASCPPV